MPAITFTVNHSSGLHARPAALFVKLASSFPCTIKVRNLNGEKPAVNAKSVLSVLTQAVDKGHSVEITAEGERADEALQALKELVENDFGESGH